MPRSVSSPISAPTGAGPGCVAASDSADLASASRSGGSTTSAPVASDSGGQQAASRVGLTAPAFTPVKAAVPPAPSSLASTGSGTVSAPTQMSTRSPAARAAAATVSRPGHGLFGRVDPTHAKSGKLAAQPGLSLVQVPRQDQRYRHAVLPAAQAAVTRA